MAKGSRKGANSTRKLNKATRSTKKHVLTIPELRKAFDHMDKVVEHLRKTAKHSFSDAVVSYREEWRKTFKRDLPPADAAAYLKFRYGLKSGKTRRSKTRGGSMRGGATPSALAGAPLDYQLRAGVTGTYGNFPSYQTQGLDRFYSSAINADCGKASAPTDVSQVSQAGGAALDGLFRPMLTGAPPSMPYISMMTHKGVPEYPSSDPVGYAPFRPMPQAITNPTFANQSLRTYGADVYKTAASPQLR
jgi:hypothetical protein